MELIKYRNDEADGELCATEHYYERKGDTEYVYVCDVLKMPHTLSVLQKFVVLICKNAQRMDSSDPPTDEQMAYLQAKRAHLLLYIKNINVGCTGRGREVFRAIQSERKNLLNDFEKLFTEYVATSVPIPDFDNYLFLRPICFNEMKYEKIGEDDYFTDIVYEDRKFEVVIRMVDLPTVWIPAPNTNLREDPILMFTIANACTNCIIKNNLTNSIFYKRSNCKIED